MKKFSDMLKEGYATVSSLPDGQGEWEDASETPDSGKFADPKKKGGESVPDAGAITKGSASAQDDIDAKAKGSFADPKKKSSDAVTDAGKIYKGSAETHELGGDAAKIFAGKMKNEEKKNAKKDDADGCECPESDDDNDDDNEDKKEDSKKKNFFNKLKNAKKDISKTTKEDIDALVKNPEFGLSEEFAKKASLIFETAIDRHVVNEAERIFALAKEYVAEQEEKFKAELTEHVDNYLSLVVEEYISKNELAIDNGLKLEMYENLFNSVRQAFEENNINLPEDGETVIDTLEAKAEQLETALDETLKSNIEMKEQLDKFKKTSIVSEMTEGMTSLEKEKFADLTKTVIYEDNQSFKENLQTLKESYFKGNVSKSSGEDNIGKGTNINLSEGKEQKETSASPEDKTIALMAKHYKNISAGK